MSRLEGIIFDCDGVLFESRQANLDYYNRILERFSYPPVLSSQQERAHLCHTASSPVVLARLMAERDLPAALAFAAELDYREFIPSLTPEPGVLAVLNELSRHYPLAVATNRGRSVQPILSHFGIQEYFSVVVTSHDVGRPKPAPDMLLLAATKLGVNIENCLFVGDSELDQQAATAARARFVAYGGLLAGEHAVRQHQQLLDYLGL